MSFDNFLFPSSPPPSPCYQAKSDCLDYYAQCMGDTYSTPDSSFQIETISHTILQGISTPPTQPGIVQNEKRYTLRKLSHNLDESVNILSLITEKYSQGLHFPKMSWRDFNSEKKGFINLGHERKIKRSSEREMNGQVFLICEYIKSLVFNEMDNEVIKNIISQIRYRSVKSSYSSVYKSFNNVTATTPLAKCLKLKTNLTIINNGINKIIALKKKSLNQVETA